MKRWLCALVLLAAADLIGACGSTRGGFGGGPDATTGDGGTGNDGGLFDTDGAVPSGDCSSTSQDLTGCACNTPGATQACYTGDPTTRHVGTCKDGTQTCQGGIEFPTWSACTGAVVPVTESCTGTVDSNCNGKVGCADPACATNPACQTGCTNGDTRLCYDGPAGTENRGTCKDGTQTCTNGQWPTTCSNEVLPTKENCCDALDHNCNGLRGCLDLFACMLPTPAACCSTQCAPTLDPGCVCPDGSGDTETCPAGDHVKHSGPVLGGYDECCPCTDCSDINCCGNSVCAGSPTCAGLNCAPLPASCNGKVNTDCDDFPEDCDEPCCLCSNCP